MFIFHITQTKKVPLTSFRECENTELVIVCKETSKNKFKLSFRSKQYINVAKIAHAFDGGGHVRAAGAYMEATILHKLQSTNATMLRGISMNGFLLVNKPEGITSYDVIRKLKTFLPKKTKIGHSGTLDPFATGLLIVAIGRDYTRQLNTLLNLDKTYQAEITFGTETDSYDIDGKLTLKNLMMTLPIS